MGIWQAGIDTLRLAPWPRQLIGHGFDVAYLHYFAQLPASVLQIEGQLETIDRLHNEVMELAANVGFAGLLAYMSSIGLVLRAAYEALGRGIVAAGAAPGDAVVPSLARRLARHSRRSLRWFLLAPWPAGLLGALLAAGLMGKAVAGIGFGLGAGAAWALLLAAQAWRCMRQPVRAQPVTAREITIAALAATVLAFWLDAQISLPVMSTRIVFFALAALLVVLADGVDATDNHDDAQVAAFSGPALSIWAWGAGCEPCGGTGGLVSCALRLCRACADADLRCGQGLVAGGARCDGVGGVVGQAARRTYERTRLVKPRFE